MRVGKFTQEVDSRSTSQWRMCMYINIYSRYLCKGDHYTYSHSVEIVQRVQSVYELVVRAQKKKRKIKTIIHPAVCGSVSGPVGLKSKKLLQQCPTSSLLVWFCDVIRIFKCKSVRPCVEKLVLDGNLLLCFVSEFPI